MQPNYDKSKTVELSDLVSQPECLKLLILHTPFNLNISALPLCLNLVKLDLSRNNLSSFPYLGHLSNLRFIYVHENKLDARALMGIFEEDHNRQARSPLSKTILWVTYWGNKNEFQARHYIANHTSALAVDNYMIVPEQRNPALIVNRPTIPPFDEITDIVYILNNRRKFNKNATEDEYMKEFWDDIWELRKKQIEMNPALKIQKVFRGWLWRTSQSRGKAVQTAGNELVGKVFRAWVKQHKYEMKLRRILTKKNKTYLLLPLKQMRFEIQKDKIIKFARQAKSRVLLRKSLNSAEYKFYHSLKSFYSLMKSLYSSLQLERCERLYIHYQNIQSFQKFIIPFIKTVNPSSTLAIHDNDRILLRSLYTDLKSATQFLRILTINQKSSFTFVMPDRTADKSTRQRMFDSVLKCKAQLKPLYGAKNINFSHKQTSRMNKIYSNFLSSRKTNLSELSYVGGDQKMLRDVVRGVYFYNLGHLTGSRKPENKIEILSESHIKKVCAAQVIQRIWRGYSLRKNFKQKAQFLYTRNRAAIKIQRWVRKLRWNNRRDFIFEQARYIKQFANNCFYISMSDYLKLVQPASEESDNASDRYWNSSRMTFPEQNIVPYIKRDTKEILISWKSEPECEGAYICRSLSKQLFNNNFNSKVFDSWRIPVPNFQTDGDSYYEVDISHLVHYQTETAVISKKVGKFLQIKCLSKYDCRMRVLGISLLSYRFNKKNKISLFPREYLNLNQLEINQRSPVFNKSAIFIFPKNSQLKIESAAKQSKCYDVNAKFYVNPESNKMPIRYSADLQIVIVHNEMESPNKVRPLGRSYSYQENGNFDIEDFLIAETGNIRLDPNVRKAKLDNQQIKFVEKQKRSFKSFKMEKKLKVRPPPRGSKPQPSFLLDNAKRPAGQRLTTQPELTHERSLGSIAFSEQKSLQKDERHSSIQKQEKSIRHHYVSEVATKNRSHKVTHSEERSKGKNLDDFTKNFINQGNFLQSQFMNGHYKRIKSEIERGGVDRVEQARIRQSEKYETLKKRLQEKKKYARQQHQEHKDLLSKSETEKKAQMESKKIIRTEPSEHKYSNRKSYKRMKVSFAEECYPIIGRKPQTETNIE